MVSLNYVFQKISPRKKIPDIKQHWLSAVILKNTTLLDDPKLVN